MNDKQREKVEDYISGFTSMRSTGLFSVGAIIADTNEMKTVLSMLPDSFVVVKEDDTNSIIKGLEDGSTCVVSVSQIPEDFKKILYSFQNGILTTPERTVIFHPESRLLLIVDEKDFEEIGRYVTSVCG